jgi:hypothetical protein
MNLAYAKERLHTIQETTKSPLKSMYIQKALDELGQIPEAIGEVELERTEYDNMLERICYHWRRR